MKKGLFFVLALSLMLSTAAFAADTIKIGLMAPLTGKWANEGQEMKQVVDLLADELNAAGGLLGKKVEVISEDDAGDPRQGALAAQRLSTQDVVASVGTYGSSTTEATQGIYDEYEIIQIANASTAVRLSEKGLPLFFRSCPRDDEQGIVGAKTLIKAGYKKIALLHDNTSYASGLATEIRNELEREGVKPVFFEALTPGEQDYAAILTKMKGANPDVVFFTGYYPEAGLMLRQKKEMGWNVPFMGGDATNNPDLIKSAGKDAAAGYMLVSPPVPGDLDTPEAKAFLDAFKKKYTGQPGSIWSVLAGDGFNVICEAIQKAGTTDTKKVAEYLKTQMKDFPGLTGKLAFNNKGDRVGDVYRIYKVDAGGNFVLQQ
ncbi:branched-chain amino acid ABC transporter substr ate-binding protein [Desulfonema ishimotonii]|uniref:Branched-chain amino acid ABC transporter substr ate-binding protein n=1 Tax=Desulfonema ishimotonii TaxID=45657 RepID=A0A401G380_9BACT|nr:branched-chain amino acid ABC transporter substrate-binding protein [Desulfonema ishimotonii]GBC63699.1 branched-chain amino acid ABC transporter substr ate-binding protein [Desulfonema ishimotonii]